MLPILGLEVSMTIIEAINRVDALKPNAFTQTEKVEWLSMLDGMVKKLIIDTHEGGDDVTFNGYDESTPMDTELLIPYPYDDCYLTWLESKISYHNAEYAKYNNAIIRFNDTYKEFSNEYNRNHMPYGKDIKYF